MMKKSPMKILNYCKAILPAFLFFFLIGNANGQIGIEGPQTICVLDSGTFTAFSNDPDATFLWDFGNGNTGEGSTVTISYTTTGTYTITVVDWISGDEAFIVINVVPCSIIGNIEPCQWDCESYTLPGSAGGAVTWSVSDFFGNTFTTNDFGLICWDFPPGDYLLTAQWIGPNGVVNSISTDIIVSGGGQPISIVSLANTFCEADSINPSSCEKICANSTAIYTVPGGQDVEWEIQGAESFTANGNSVEVEWGDPGNGLVSAFTVGGTSSNMIVNCFKSNDLDFQNQTVTLWADVQGGTGPYTYEWLTTSGNIVSSGASVVVDSSGDYLVQITDADGNVQTCSLFVIEDFQSNCSSFVLSPNSTSITHQSFCGVNEASINLEGISGANIVYQWSNGSTTQSLSNLSQGTYTVTIIDVATNGCEFVQSFIIGCTQSTNTCSSETSLCIDILEDPDAKVATIPAATNGVISICEGQTVLFNNESEGATLFEWDFGNGNISSNMHTEQIYDNAGTYQAYLIARNDCYCSDTTFFTIEVENAVTPIIDCVGTICEGQTVTYNADASCGTYNWIVTGNYNIIDGGGTGDDFISIEWLTGAEGIIELSVSGCTGGAVCLFPTVEVIPIISDDAEIEGPEKVCQEDEAIYFIDDYDGTDFIWTVSSGGNILEGQNTNRIKVKWDGPVSPNADQFVSVDYQNCYLGCEGSDQLDVYILPNLFIEGNIEACENETSTHAAKKTSIGANDVACDWTVTYGNGTVVWTSPSPMSTVNLDWNTISAGDGRYVIHAIPSNPFEVCDAAFTTYVNIIQPPPTVTSIDGETGICAGQTYTYTANTSENDVQFSWTINDGGNISTQQGKTINVIFGNTPPYTLSVTQISTAGLACESEAIDLSVFPLPSFTVSGDGNICQESEGTYVTSSFTNVQYEWAVVPSDAGTITSGQNSNIVNVFWHQDGNAQVQVTICGTTESTPVTVLTKPQPTVNAPTHVCRNETAIVSSNNVFASYLWKNENGGTISSNPSIEVGPGTYELEVSDVFGCANNIAFTIEEHPLPNVAISVPGTRLICYANGDPAVEIHATEVPNGYTYVWLHDDVVIPGASGSVITTMEYGKFNAQVTDVNGCVTESKPVFLYEFCDPVGICNNPSLAALPCEEGTSIQFDFATTGSCDIVNFTNTSPDYQPGTLEWDFDDLNSGGDNTSTLENPTHQFTRVGYYIVTLVARNTAGQECWESKLVEVPIVANFDFGQACVGAPVEFEDLSAFLPDESIASWFWDFGDPALGASNNSTDQNPMHIYNTPGSYEVTLTSTHTSGCIATKTKTVVINPLPTLSFNDPTLTCQGTALSFEAQSPNNIVAYNWVFDDPASGSANTSQIASPWHAFAADGNYSVVCIGTDVYGCEVTTPNTITIESNTLNGFITMSPVSPLCEGDVTTMTAPAGGTGWTWSETSSVNSIMTGEAGVYIVTITDDKGCEYITPPATLDVIPLPTATIQAVEYNEFGEPVGSFYDGYATCEGEDVFMQVVENADYTYTWSNGVIGNELVFSKERDNLLSAGTYNFTLEILDNTSGCMNSVGPFTVIIHLTPTDIMISYSPVANCENTLTTFQVDNPDASLTYIWNTGELGTSISTSVAGKYFVKGITNLGCTGESNQLEIQQGPDIKKIPSGCHTRCNPDTICLPTINNIVSYQWYFNGTAMAPPNGNIGDMIADQSGDYYVEMTDGNGCTAASEVLTLDLFDGFGSFTGDVYMDVNDNGIIDASDTLVNAVDVILTTGGIAQDTFTTGTNGTYDFLNILSTNYTLALDPSTLPPNTAPVVMSVDTELVGCDDMETVDWLLQPTCVTSSSSLDLSTCFGVDVIIDGILIPPSTPTDLMLTDVIGCDSIVTVTVTELPDPDIFTTLYACDGNDISYNGSTLIAGTTTPFNLTNTDGCNYVETVEVVPFPTSVTPLDFQVCPGETVEYNGQELSAGFQNEFVFTNVDGCDSTIIVTVTAYPSMQYDVAAADACWNATDGSITISNSSGVGTLMYSLDGNNFQTTPSFESLMPTDYMVYVQDGNGCETQQDISVNSIEPIEVNMIVPLLPCNGEEVIIEPEFTSGDMSTVSFEWDDGSTLSQMMTNEAGTYFVEISNSCEIIVEEIQVDYEFENRGDYIFVPNAFTPDGDGMNDIFFPMPAGDITVEAIDFYVFDRWGNHVYETHTINEGWDGKMDNKMYKPGVYVWYIRADVTSCGRTFEWYKEGDVTIVK